MCGIAKVKAIGVSLGKYLNAEPATAAVDDLEAVSSLRCEANPG
jgi:hypothetical protein